MLIDIVEPIAKLIKIPTASKSATMFLKNLISYIKNVKIGKIQSHSSRISLREQIPKCSLMTSGSFVPEHIREYVQSESKAYATYEATYKGRMFRIVMVYDDLNVERKKAIVVDMFKWLAMIVDMGRLATNCGKTTTVYCYLTPFKKELPTSRDVILSYDNANSAVTTSCSDSNEICIFREEEMFKVFIHETFHAFNLDFSLQMKEQHVKQMKQLYNIKSEFKIFETYAETWAEIINILFLSGDVGTVNKMLQAEVAFSLHQMNKVLSYMGLDYSDLINSSGIHKYKEETNVFCYYVLKTVCLFHWSDFIDFCSGSLKYERDVSDFIVFIREKYKDARFINNAYLDLSKKSTRTMRMTFWEN
jgi:hypothetical protein